jgi:hypothetical protein
MNLRDELGVQLQAITEKTPRHVVPTIEAATQQLRDAGLVVSALQPGQTITDFELPDTRRAREQCKPSAFRSHSGLVLSWYMVPFLQFDSPGLAGAP